MNLLSQFSADYQIKPHAATGSDQRVTELEREVSQLTNKVLMLQNENQDLRSVQVADNSTEKHDEQNWGGDSDLSFEHSSQDKLVQDKL